MSGHITSVLEILDLEFLEAGLAGGRQRITSTPGGQFLVAFPSRRLPSGLDSDKNGVVFFRQAAGVSTVTRRIVLEKSSELAGDTRYRWSEVVSSRAQLAAAILPKGYALADAEPRPIASRVVEQRLAVYWAPDGNSISFSLNRSADDPLIAAKRLNRGSRTGGEVPELPGIVPIRVRRPIAAIAMPAVAVVLIVAWFTFTGLRPERNPDPGESSNAEVSLPSAEYGQSYALVVGINRYPSPKWKDLSHARKDAQSMAELLEDHGFHVETFLDADATKEVILRYFEDLAPALRTNDRLLFFFAGHGHTSVYDGVQFGYLVPYDAEDEATYVSMEKLHELSKKVGAAKHQLFLLDSCFGGLIGTRAGSLDGQGSAYIRDVMSRRARQVLTAGGKDQIVVDGVFTEYLLEALEQGLADANGDGYVTFSELTGYVIPRATNEYQTPGYATLPGHQMGEFVFQVARGASPGHTP